MKWEKIGAVWGASPFFAERVIRHRKRLPREVVEPSYLEILKKKCVEVALVDMV